MGIEAEEVLELINRRIYLHMVDNATQVDYTLYDKETMRQVFRSQVEMSAVWDQPAMGFFNAARYAVAEDCGINIVSVESVPLDMLQTLSSIQHDPPLDEYPMPDQSCTMADVACMGYLKDDFLPVSDETAADLSQQGFTIYEANAFGNVVGPVEISKSYHELFVIARKDWENSPAFHEAAADRMNHQKERELAFLCQKQNCFAIYQLNHQNPDLIYIRHESLENLLDEGQRPRRENYELVYTAPLPEGTGLNTLWNRFNTDHPPDYLHPSMSVSDVIAVKQNGTVTCYYVDQFSFATLDGFLAQRPRLAKMSKPSIKAQLAAKPVPGDQPAQKAKDLEVR